MNMAKKTSAKKTKRPQPSTGDTNKNVPVSKQTAGGVTGAVLGGAVAGPLGAIAGGLTGAMVGDASAQGKKPVKRAVDAISSEVREGNFKDNVRSVVKRVTSTFKSMRGGKKTKKATSTKKSATKSSSATKKSKSKPAKKKGKAATKKKAGAGPKKKRAKKKSCRRIACIRGRSNVAACSSHGTA